MSDNGPILTAKELLEYRRSTGALPDFPPPKMVIFVPQKSLATYIYKKYSVKRIKGFAGEFYLLKKFKGQVAISTNFGIGAPVVAGLTDEFSTLGVKQFALIGTAGALQEKMQSGDIVLSTGAARGEGVSRHYIPPGEIVETSTELTGRFSQLLSENKFSHVTGLTWTTDAPFRELRDEVINYQKRGVLAVDMEAAGMLSVATAYHLPAVAVFSIADTLSNGKWHMSKDLRHTLASLSILFETALTAMAFPNILVVDG